MSRRRQEPPEPEDAVPTVTIVGSVRPGSALDRLFNHGECLLGCGRKADAPNALCATCQAKADR